MHQTLELADWRRRVAELYAQVRAAPDPGDGHRVWRAGRDRLFREHPQSPLESDSPLRDTGLPCWPYDPALRFDVPLQPAEPEERAIESSSDGMIRLRRVGQVSLAAIGVRLDVVARAIRGWALPTTARRHRRDGQLRRRALPARHGQGRRPRSGRAAPRRRLQLRLPPVLPLQQRVGVPAGPGGQHHRRADPCRRANVTNSQAHARSTGRGADGKGVTWAVQPSVAPHPSKQ